MFYRAVRDTTSEIAIMKHNFYMTKKDTFWEFSQPELIWELNNKLITEADIKEFQMAINCTKSTYKEKKVLF